MGVSGTPSRVRSQVDSVDKNLPPLAGLEPRSSRSTATQALCSATDQTHSKPKNVFLHIFCVRMCAKCVIKCLFGTHGVTNVFHYRKISVTSKEKCYKNVPLTLWIAYSHIPNSMCFICVKKKSLKLFRCHIYLLILTHREWNVL